MAWRDSFRRRRFLVFRTCRAACGRVPSLLFCRRHVKRHMRTLLIWRDGRAAECGGLENRSPKGPGVRIPLPPPTHKARIQAIRDAHPGHLSARPLRPLPPASTRLTAKPPCYPASNFSPDTPDIPAVGHPARARAGGAQPAVPVAPFRARCLWARCRHGDRPNRRGARRRFHHIPLDLKPWKCAGTRRGVILAG